jgi:hypothetical protein
VARGVSGITVTLVEYFSFLECGFFVDFRYDSTYDSAFSVRQAWFAEFRGPNR